MWAGFGPDADAALVELIARYMRSAASPNAAAACEVMSGEIDIRGRRRELARRPGPSIGNAARSEDGNGRNAIDHDGNGPLSSQFR